MPGGTPGIVAAVFVGRRASTRAQAQRSFSWEQLGNSRRTLTAACVKLSTAWRFCPPGCPEVLSACLRTRVRARIIVWGKRCQNRGRFWRRPVETAWGHPLISRFSRPFAFLQKGVEPGYEAGNPILVTRSLKRTSSQRTGLAPCFLPCVSAIVSLRSLLFYLFKQSLESRSSRPMGQDHPAPTTNRFLGVT
jgi:hypothetical protein